MLVNNKPTQSIWYNSTTHKVQIIDQRKLPFSFEILDVKTLEEAYNAIEKMIIRGAPLIGIMAAYGLFLAAEENTTLESLSKAGEYLKSSRPTAVNLERIIDDCLNDFKEYNPKDVALWFLEKAKEVEANEINYCSNIGDYGLPLIEEIYQRTKKTVNILTHCNAGWLACCDWGTATAPMYKAHLKGIPIHVWVDETRPRNQGAKLTAWELKQAGVPYTVIPDNTGGHLMQHELVDIVFVGSDRTTRNGDVANKIGTYLKALAAFDNKVPFYVALPSTTIDFNMVDGVKNIPIEQRDKDEVLKMDGLYEGNVIESVIIPEDTPIANHGFDVTPARLVSGLITERGVCNASENGILNLFPEHV